MAKLVMPKFENEAQEAQWWFEHRAEVADDMLAALRQGSLGEGSVARRARKVREQSSGTPSADNLVSSGTPNKH